MLQYFCKYITVIKRNKCTVQEGKIFHLRTIPFRGVPLSVVNYIILLNPAIILLICKG